MDSPPKQKRVTRLVRQFSRRSLLATAVGMGGCSLPVFLQMKSTAEPDAEPNGKAKSCIIVYCWGGMSHLESWDPKPDTPAEFRGEFAPISTATPGIQIGEHLPLLAQQTEKL